MRSKLEGEFFGGVCKHFAGITVLHSYQSGMSFYSPIKAIMEVHVFGLGLLLILFPAP